MTRFGAAFLIFTNPPIRSVRADTSYDRGQMDNHFRPCIFIESNDHFLVRRS